MTKYNARRLTGPWKSGYVLDLHTTSSVFIGYDEFGHVQFDTTYSEIGGLLNRLKYHSDRSALPQLIEPAAAFLRAWTIEFTAVVPVPPTKVYRRFQPVLALATEIARTFKVPLLRNSLRKIKEVPELKNIYDPDERKRLLDGAFEANAGPIRGQQILLVDDLYRSGATMNAIAHALSSAGALEVYAFAFTQTRIKR